MIAEDDRPPSRADESKQRDRSEGDERDAAARSRYDVWIVGDLEHPEFSWGPLGDGASCRHFDRRALPNAEQLARESPPSLIVFWSERPGTTDAALIEAWGERFPLARRLQVIGTWNEGELRTGRPATTIERIRWLDWRQLTPAQLDRIGRWRPATWSPTERWLEFGANEPDANELGSAMPGDRDESAVDSSDTRRVVGIVASVRTAYEPLADLVERCGACPAWVRGATVSGAGAERIGTALVAQIIDRDGFEEKAEGSGLSLPRERTAVAIGFPRRDEARDWERQASLILTKPYDIRPLLDWLRDRIADAEASGRAGCDGPEPRFRGDRIGS